MAKKTCRHDNDMGIPPEPSPRVDIYQEEQDQLNGGGSGNVHSAPQRADSRGGSRHVTSASVAAVPRWPSSREGLSNSASAPSGVSLAYPIRAISTSPEQNRNRKAPNQHDRGRWGDAPTSRAGNEANPVFITRSDSPGSSSLPARAHATMPLRRSNSAASEAFSTGDSGFSCGNNSVKSAGVSVASSTDPDVLKAEIHRLQAALMNEFKGGNRFVGGAQFKASNASRKGHVGATGGNSCGGCLQVCACKKTCHSFGRKTPIRAAVLSCIGGIPTISLERWSCGSLPEETQLKSRTLSSRAIVDIASGGAKATLDEGIAWAGEGCGSARFRW